MPITAAVERSKSHSEIVHVEVPDPIAAARALVAAHPDDDIDYTDVGDGTRNIDIWAADPDDDDGMKWRLMLEVAS